MRRLNRQLFCESLDRFDRQVANTPQIDRFCSASAWVMPAFDALSPDHQLWVWEASKSDGFVALCQGAHPRVGRYIQPLEASWGLASPIIGDDPAGVTREFVTEARQHCAQWDILFLTGINESSAQFGELVRGFQADHFMGVGPSMGRQYARLDGGLDGFLSRRSSKFRANIRRAQRRADDAGIRFAYRDQFDADGACQRVFDRIIRVERDSWKGRQGVGIAQGRMYDFYRAMLPRLAQNGALRVIFATLDDVDIAYCFGGVFGTTYRGLQMSYHQDYGQYSPGNLVQVEMIRNLYDGGIDVYDMGQSMEYKSSWTDEEFETVAVIVRQ